MLKRGLSFSIHDVRVLKTSQIKNLFGGMVTNMRAARAARTLD